MSSPQIIIIHDDWNDNYPLIIHLRDLYGDKNVVFIKNSQDGIQYMSTAPIRKTIVILDYKFKSGEPTGGDVFRRIREKSSLIYVIIVTKNEPKNINPEDFREFVNSHALAIANPSGDYKHISELVSKAIKHLNVRADIILEEWICSKPEEERDKPYMAIADGKVFSLNDILDNIKQQTGVGIELAGTVLDLAIDLTMKRLKLRND